MSDIPKKSSYVLGFRAGDKSSIIGESVSSFKEIDDHRRMLKKLTE
jgi:hypothetical protein